MTRTSAGKVEMDILQVRDAFLQSAAAEERAQEFYNQRINEHGKNFSPDGEYPRVLVHLLPLDSFVRPPKYRVGELLAQGQSFLPIGTYNQTHRVNLDGLVFYDGPNDNSRVQIFRNGCVEGLYRCNSTFDDSKIPAIPIPRLELIIMERLPQWIAGLGALGMHPPIAIYISLLGLGRGKIFFSDGDGLLFTRPTPADQLRLPDTVLTDAAQSLGPVLRYTFDALWNSFNEPKSPNFDESGEYKRPR
jgi:hypothetical protein